MFTRTGWGLRIETARDRILKKRLERRVRQLIWFILLPLLACDPTPGEVEKTDLTSILSGDDVDGFERAIEPREFRFPADHGAHPGFRNEWWYMTGNLDADGRRFGFQATFFRFALSPDRGEERDSAWAATDIWMAHAALTDITGARHYADERFSRGALGLAGARIDPFRVWLEDWSLQGGDKGFPWRLRVQGDKFGLDLEFDQLRLPVLQGRDGLSQKSDMSGNASYYYSITRLSTLGTLTLNGEQFSVEGLSWLDREWSTSSLGEDQVGWDWFSLHLNDGTDLMYYRLRSRSGVADPHSAGSILFEGGSKQVLGPDDVTMAPRKWWQSSTGRRYPIAWSITIKPLMRSFVIAAAVDDQEMDLSISYWEGAVDVLQGGRAVGRGYLEMTGY